MSFGKKRSKRAAGIFDKGLGEDIGTETERTNRDRR